jgi:hypothetical protein
MTEQRATELDLYDSVADEKTRTCLQQLFDNTKNLQAQVDRLVDLITNASNLTTLQTQVSQDFSGESIASSTESATDVSAFSAQFSAINHNHDSSYNNFVLDQATTTVLGGIKLGANLTYNSSTDQVDAYRYKYSLFVTSRKRIDKRRNSGWFVPFGQWGYSFSE